MSRFIRSKTEPIHHSPEGYAMSWSLVSRYRPEPPYEEMAKRHSKLPVITSMDLSE